MTTLAHPSPVALPARAPAAARTVLGLLRHLRTGTLDLVLPDGMRLQFGSARAHEPHASMHLHDWSACAAVLRSGDIGFADAYIDGRWSTPDLARLLRLLIANRDAMSSLVYGRWWGVLAHRLRHLFRRNTRSGSRRNIHAHYDIGNPFYGLWLDETMSYSAALFDGDLAQPTASAQQSKMARALRECGIAPGQRLLEIGCGWGSLARVAAQDFGAEVTGVTLSTEQLAFARTRIADQGLDGRVTLRLQDYRDIADGAFDGIVSIEMFEAVGRAYWDAYFQSVHRLLVPGGRACIQTIVIRDDLFERYARGTDFIQQTIFPGGMLPSCEQFRAAAGRAGLSVQRELRFGADYAETLRRWHVDFAAREAQVRALGMDTRFVRTWSFYLAYCEAAFDAGSTDVVQFTLAKP